MRTKIEIKRVGQLLAQGIDAETNKRIEHQIIAPGVSVGSYLRMLKAHGLVTEVDGKLMLKKDKVELVASAA